jgi:hypothetical protein
MMWKPTSIQLIAVANPIDATGLNIIESDEIEVAWNTVKVLDTKLIKSGEQVFSDVDFLAAHHDWRNSDLVLRCKQGGELLLSCLRQLRQCLAVAMRGSIITISISQEVTDDKPMVRSELPWRGTRDGFNPSWLADPGPYLARAAGFATSRDTHSARQKQRR